MTPEELEDLKRKAALWDREVALWNRTLAWGQRVLVPKYGPFDETEGGSPEGSLVLREARQLVRETSGGDCQRPGL